MRELTTTEQELIDQLVAFWCDESRGLSEEFYRALAALGRQNRDATSVFRLLTDEVFNLRTPGRAKSYRQEFSSEEAYRSRLMMRVETTLSLVPKPVAASEPPAYMRNVRADIAEYWDTGNLPPNLESSIRDYFNEPAGLKEFWYHVFEQITKHGRSAYNMKALGYEDSQFGFRKYLLAATQAAIDSTAATEKAILAGYVTPDEATREKALVEFEALGKRMQVANSRAELVQLSRRRAKVAHFTGREFVYHTRCWKCNARISHDIHARCRTCHRYICGSEHCGACECTWQDEHPW